MSDVTMHVTTGLLGATLVAAILIALVHRRAGRRTGPAMQSRAPMQTAVKSVASIDKELLRAQITAAMRRLEINVTRLKKHLKTQVIDVDHVSGTLWQPMKVSSAREDARPATKLQRGVALRQQTLPFRGLLSFASRNAERGAIDHQAEISKLQAELRDKCRLLDEREDAIKKLRDELNAVHEIDDALRCSNITSRRRNVAIEKKLRREISDLQAQLLETTKARAELRRDR
jgi:hypothetical protein